MSVTTNARRAHAARVGGLCLMTAAAVVIPRVALAAGAANPTIRATIGSDGTVKSVQQYAGGTSSAYHGTLPLALTITHAAAGAGQTYTYTVANTFSRTQTVKYSDTAGHQHSTTLQLQLPLVAQLGVDVPKSMGTLDASGASVSTDSAGTRHVLYNLVLFSPLGSPTQSVVLTTGAA
ncbi:MAG: hypothetical protein JO222_11245, partial [Frankiales bacterium]|nr:hypothetical protein [Frankiales bacterium]